MAAFLTGKNVATIAVSKAIAKMIIIEGMPMLNIEAPNTLPTSSLSSIHPPMLAPIDNPVQISAITKDSEKNILNTSLPLAPTARRIPISRFLLEIDIEIKLESKRAAKTV